MEREERKRRQRGGKNQESNDLSIKKTVHQRKKRGGQTKKDEDENGTGRKEGSRTSKRMHGKQRKNEGARHKSEGRVEFTNTEIKQISFSEVREAETSTITMENCGGKEGERVIQEAELARKRKRSRTKNEQKRSNQIMKPATSESFALDSDPPSFPATSGFFGQAVSA